MGREMVEVNNELYHSLGERWYHAKDDPIALLRAEAKVKNPWVMDAIRTEFKDRSPKSLNVLDVGCGGGFLANELSQAGYRVSGLDISESSLQVARDHDVTGQVSYQPGDAYELPFKDQSFEIVTCMDFLEHVENPNKVIAEASRVLKPDGLFVFHTFNRNWLSKIIIIKGVEWFVKNTPENMHILRLFVKPEELKAYCETSSLRVKRMVGIAPKIDRAFFKMLRTREVPENFGFKINSSTLLGYLGYATKINF